MADIESTFSYDSDFSKVTDELRQLVREASNANSVFAQLNKTAASVKMDAARTFAAQAGFAGFKAQIVDLKGSTEQFGEALMKNKLTMKEYFSEAAKAYKKDSKARALAEREVRRAQSTVVGLGDINGKRKGILVTPQSLDMSNTTTQLQVASKQYEIFNKLVNQGATELVNWGKNTQWAGRQLTVGLTVPMSIFSTQAIKAFAEVDKEITRFRKVYGSDLTGTVEDGTTAMINQIQSMGSEFAKQYGIASKETIALAADLAAAGFEGQKLANAVNQTTRLMVLGEVDRQDAMKATLSIQTAFNQNSKELAQSIDFLNQVENQTSASLQDLTDAIPKAGPVIQALGGSVKDLSILMTALREGGISAGEGANALKSGLASLISPTNRAIEASRQLGIDLQGVVKRNKGELMPMLIDFQSQLKGLDDFSKAKVIEEIFGKYQFARISALFDNLNQQGSQTVNMIKLMNMSADELAKKSYSELQQQQNAPSTRLAAMQQQLTEQLVKVGADLAQSVLPVMQAGLDILQKIVDGFNNLPSPIKSFVKLLGGLTAAAGPLLMLAGIFGNLIGNAVKFGMSIINMFKKMTGHPVKQLQILSDEELAAKLAADQLTGAYERQKTSISQLTAALDLYIANLRTAASIAPPGAISPGPRRGPAPVRRATGGVIYAQNGVNSAGRINGYGGGDTVPAMLEPGEFVINKKSSSKYAPLLRDINQGKDIPGYEKGWTGAGKFNTLTATNPAGLGWGQLKGGPQEVLGRNVGEMANTLTGGKQFELQLARMTTSALKDFEQFAKNAPSGALKEWAHNASANWVEALQNPKTHAIHPLANIPSGIPENISKLLSAFKEFADIDVQLNAIKNNSKWNASHLVGGKGTFIDASGKMVSTAEYIGTTAMEPYEYNNLINILGGGGRYGKTEQQRYARLQEKYASHFSKSWKVPPGHPDVDRALRLLAGTGAPVGYEDTKFMQRIISTINENPAFKEAVTGGKSRIGQYLETSTKYLNTIGNMSQSRFAEFRANSSIFGVLNSVPEAMLGELFQGSTNIFERYATLEKEFAPLKTLIMRNASPQQIQEFIFDTSSKLTGRTIIPENTLNAIQEELASKPGHSLLSSNGTQITKIVGGRDVKTGREKLTRHPNKAYAVADETFQMFKGPKGERLVRYRVMTPKGPVVFERPVQYAKGGMALPPGTSLKNGILHAEGGVLGMKEMIAKAKSVKVGQPTLHKILTPRERLLKKEIDDELQTSSLNLTKMDEEKAKVFAKSQIATERDMMLYRGTSIDEKLFMSLKPGDRFSSGRIEALSTSPDVAESFLIPRLSGGEYRYTSIDVNDLKMLGINPETWGGPGDYGMFRRATNRKEEKELIEMKRRINVLKYRRNRDWSKNLQADIKKAEEELAILEEQFNAANRANPNLWRENGKEWSRLAAPVNAKKRELDGMKQQFKNFGGATYARNASFEAKTLAKYKREKLNLLPVKVTYKTPKGTFVYMLDDAQRLREFELNAGLSGVIESIGMNEAGTMGEMTVLVTDSMRLPQQFAFGGPVGKWNRPFKPNDPSMAAIKDWTGGEMSQFRNTKMHPIIKGKRVVGYRKGLNPNFNKQKLYSLLDSLGILPEGIAMRRASTLNPGISTEFADAQQLKLMEAIRTGRFDDIFGMELNQKGLASFSSLDEKVGANGVMGIGRFHMREEPMAFGKNLRKGTGKIESGVGGRLAGPQGFEQVFFQHTTSGVERGRDISANKVYGGKTMLDEVLTYKMNSIIEAVSSDLATRKTIFHTRGVPGFALGGMMPPAAREKFMMEQAQSQELVATFGRMNPPTAGHKKLLDIAATTASERGADFKFGVSHTVDKKRNPFSWQQKAAMIDETMSEYAQQLIRSEALRSPVQFIDSALEAGYKKLTFVIGEDRVASFDFLKAMGAEKGLNVELIAVPRPQGAISSTAVREALARGDAEFVAQSLPETLSAADRKRIAEARIEQFKATATHLATGGQLSGYGGGDKIPAMLEPGEFVINKESTARYAPLLKEINKGTIPGFANGTPDALAARPDLAAKYEKGAKLSQGGGGLMGAGMSMAFMPMMVDSFKTATSPLMKAMLGLALATQALQITMVALGGIIKLNTLAQAAGGWGTFAKGGLGKAGKFLSFGMVGKGAALSKGLNQAAGVGRLGAGAAERAGAARVVAANAGGGKVTQFAAGKIASGIAQGGLKAGVAKAAAAAFTMGTKAIPVIGWALTLWQVGNMIRDWKVAQWVEEVRDVFGEATEMAKVYNIELNKSTEALNKNRTAAVGYGLAIKPQAKGAVDKAYESAIQKDYGKAIESIKGLNNEQDKANRLATIYASLVAQGFDVKQAKEITAEIARQAQATGAFNEVYPRLQSSIKDTATALQVLDDTFAYHINQLGTAEEKAAALEEVYARIQGTAALSPVQAAISTQNVITTTANTAGGGDAIKGLIEGQLAGIGANEKDIENITKRLFEGQNIDWASKKGQEVGTLIATGIQAGLGREDFLGKTPAQIEEAVASAVALQQAKIDLNTQLEGTIKGLNDAITATNKKYNDQIDAIEAEKEAIQKAHDKKMKMYDDEAKALQDRADLIRKNADFYISQLQKEYDTEQYYQKQRETSINALQSLAQGDIFSYLQAQTKSASDASQFGREQAIKQIEDTRDNALDALDAQLKANNEAKNTLDEATQKQLQGKDDQIAALNKARSKIIKDLNNRIKEAQAIMESPTIATGKVDEFQKKLKKTVGDLPATLQTPFKTVGTDFRNTIKTSLEKNGAQINQIFVNNADNLKAAIEDALGVTTTQGGVGEHGGARQMTIKAGDWSITVGAPVKNPDAGAGLGGKVKAPFGDTVWSRLSPTYSFDEYKWDGYKYKKTGNSSSVLSGGNQSVSYESIAQYLNRGGKVIRFSKGNIVPGYGNTDTVPAMLTPGEFVMNKNSTQANLPLLEAMNSKGKIGYNMGGHVGYRIPRMQNGGLVGAMEKEAPELHMPMTININGTNLSQTQLEDSIFRAIDRGKRAVATSLQDGGYF